MNNRAKKMAHLLCAISTLVQLSRCDYNFVVLQRLELEDSSFHTLSVHPSAPEVSCLLNGILKTLGRILDPTFSDSFKVALKMCVIARC